MTNILLRVIWRVTEIGYTLLEIVLSLLLTGLLAPTLLLLWLLNHLIRFIIQLILNCQSSKITLLSDGSDGIWSYRKSGNSRNILIVYIYSGPISLEKFQSNYEQRVLNFVAASGVKPYSKLRKIFTKKYGYYGWRDASDFNIKNHVRSVFSEPGVVVTESQLKKYLSTLTADFDDGKPQWEEIIIPRFRYNDESLENGLVKSARIYRSHHAYMDGCSNLLMTGTCMGDGVKFPYIIDPLAPLRVPRWKVGLYNLTCILMGAKTLIKNIIEASQIRSRFLMVKYSGKQLFAWSPPLSMSVLKETKDATKTSIPSIFSTVVVNALEALEDLDVAPDLDPNLSKNLSTGSSSSPGKEVSIGMVGAVLPYQDVSPKNRFTVVNFSIKSRGEDRTRLQKLKSIHREFISLTKHPDGLVNFKLFQVLGKFPSPVIQFAMKGAGTPVIYSNTPWATERVTLWGDEVIDVLGWMPLLTTAGVGLLTVSYSTTFRFCVIADESCLSQKELEFLICKIYSEIQVLHKEIKELDLTAAGLVRPTLKMATCIKTRALRV